MTTLTIDARMLKNAGVGTYIRSLVPRLIALRPDWRFYLMGRKEEMVSLAWSAGSTVGMVECAPPIYSIQEQIKLPRAIPNDTDLFWSPHYNIPLFYKGKLLVTVHDVFHLDMPEFTGGLHKRLYARTLFSALRRKADAVLCVSQFTRERLLAQTGAGKADPVAVYNGVDESWSNFDKGERPHPKPYLLYVGSVKPHKNLVGLVRAFETLLERIPHDLMIVGKKDGFITGDKRVLDAAKRLGDRVQFTGEFDYEDPLFRRYYAHADALVLPSFYESFGLPALEAMACGCPAIVSRAAALPEIYGDAAAYFDPRDPRDMAERILSVVTDEKAREDLKSKGLKRAKLYSWEKCAEGTLRVIESVL